MNHLADETSPYLRQHADNPVEWFPWGDEALAAGAGRGQADLPLHRLRLVPLVPRHGPRELRGRGHGRRSGSLVHLGQGRPRGAARPRLALHGRHPGAHRIGRLAHVGVLHARRPAVLRRHLLSHPRSATACPRSAGWSRRSAPPGRTERDEVLAQADALVDAVRREVRLAESMASPTRVRRSRGIRRRSAPGPDRAGPRTPLVPPRHRRRRAHRPGRDRPAAGFDPQWGGFGPAPKFPRPSLVELCLRHHRRTGSERSRQMAADHTRRHGRRAASTTIWSAASAATRPTPAGWCPTSRRC